MVVVEVAADTRTREAGAALRRQVEVALAKGATVCLDFSGVHRAGLSFLDEVFGVLAMSLADSQLRRLSVEAMSPRIARLRAVVERARTKAKTI